ncbi:snRNA-activating protein complex subunit 2 [Hyla sarda]|uniref:snRNA-activating protein complex subunit 2 n=1 Tax=Hyla sarda TaxID=327740 RepID=UPI0024C47078|nr:snRNA-activating protein complex subunit 2 [Hyla sarda]XP_056425067.1 snRNA-activating protein complex subunit 2 [Hyla sarda]XP_056425068.1 snRNA-activating protein complex subunit 2 [Hyla sarda]
MKPPARRRTAPHRYDDQNMPKTSHRLLWTIREKKELLWELKGQISEKTPNVEVQGRSEEEVSSYCSWLRARAAREAMQTEYGKLVRQKKIKEIQDPAPIELWTDLANRLGSSTEDAMNAAFSHMLTIASAEPLTLHHSIPSKEPVPKVPAQMSSPHGKNLQHKGSAEEELSSSGEEPTTSNLSDGRNNVDFENIYKYLSKVVRGEEPPTLSDFESAVILHLLRCIPEQLPHLDTPHIGLYLYDTYTFLTTQLKSEDTEEEEMPSQPEEANWKELGFCPLNPFMMPLELLKQKEEEVTPP